GAPSGAYQVSLDVTNTGHREGSEVAQIYIGDSHSKVRRPIRELKGFARVTLLPGETKSVTVPLDSRAFSYYDVNGKRWRTEPGDFDIYIGHSSEDIELRGKITNMGAAGKKRLEFSREALAITRGC